ncbi:hypothetical protein BaRGS_00038336, partial [Batillaria attramentaria]
MGTFNRKELIREWNSIRSRVESGRRRSVSTETPDSVCQCQGPRFSPLADYSGGQG